MARFNKNLNIFDMLKKLDELYIKEEYLKTRMIKLQKEYQQLQEDKELLQCLIMYQSNKSSRLKK